MIRTIKWLQHFKNVICVFITRSDSSIMKCLSMEKRQFISAAWTFTCSMYSSIWLKLQTYGQCATDCCYRSQRENIPLNIHKMLHHFPVHFDQWVLLCILVLAILCRHFRQLCYWRKLILLLLLLFIWSRTGKSFIQFLVSARKPLHVHCNIYVCPLELAALWLQSVTSSQNSFESETWPCLGKSIQNSLLMYTKHIHVCLTIYGLFL